MKIESARRYSLNIALVGALISVLPAASFALPRQGTGTHACSCMCHVTLQDGRTVGLPDNFNLPAQYTCLSAEEMTCNVSDPVTGSVRTGWLEGCGDGSLHLSIKPPVGHPVTNPGGGLLQAVPAR